MTLTELGRLAADRGVIVHVGVVKRDVGKTPVTITVQISDHSQRPPDAFSMEISALNPQAELALELAVRKHIDAYSRKAQKLRIV